MIGALTSSHTFRMLTAGAIFVVMVAFGMYVTLRLRVTYHMQDDLARAKADIEAIKRRGFERLNLLEERIEALEQSVYGTLEPAVSHPPRPRVVPSREPAWSVNRDRELRERIRQLERWRMEHEGWREQK